MKTIKVYMMALLGMFFMVSCGGGGDDDHNSGSGGGGSAPQTYRQSVAVSAQGGSVTVTLNDLRSAVSSIGSTPSWVVVSPQAYSSGAPSLLLEVEGNKTASERQCEVLVLAASGDKVSLTIRQNASGGSETGTGMDTPHNEQTDQPAYSPRH